MAIAAVAAAWAGLHAAADRPAPRAWARARIEAALEERLGPVDLGPDVRIDGLFRVSFGPLSTRPSRPGASPALRVDRVRVRASLPALLAGRLEPASLRLHGVRISPAHGLASRSRASRASAGRSGRTGSFPTVHFRDLVLVLPVAGRPVAVGPLDGTAAVSRGDGSDRLEVSLRTRGGGRGEAEILRGPDGLHARLDLSGFGPADLPADLLEGPVALAGGSLSLEALATGPRDLSRIEARLRLAGEGLVLRGERLAAEPVGPMDLEASGTVTLDHRLRRATLRGGEVTLLGAVRAEVEGEASFGADPGFALSARARNVDYLALVDALPPALAPPTKAPRPAGTFSAGLEVSGPLLRAAEWSLSAALDLGRLREAARRAPPVPLRAPFVAGVPTARGTVEIRVGPDNPDFVTLAEIPEHVIRAVTTGEDAGFFEHAGFDFDELRNALAAGAEGGRRMRGGSTITQQLAKNLFLTRERTLARKLREAVVTVGLEATVPKARLLEIYLNVIEWGPGIHGIGPAARHWFGKDARDLSPGEAALLAAVIPNPVRYHGILARGEPSASWRDRVDALLLKMSEQGVLSEDQLLEALGRPIVFARG
ncbi:MAG TPA: biosynthetic peptidoglycan transglycosylase [Anaeromyxobacteraceae bacterium]|nr:biosynthetic peptidoglycan transglycosylase [Anaeromyxobacteraceae bacterium]